MASSRDTRGSTLVENHFNVLSVKRVLVEWATSRNTKQFRGGNHFSALTDLAEWNIARNTRSSIHVNQYLSALTEERVSFE